MSEPVEEAAVQPDAWYCPGCGTRYPVAGECTNGHAAIELQRVDEEEVSPTASIEAPVVEDPAPVEDPPTPVQADVTPAPEPPVEKVVADVSESAVEKAKAALAAIRSTIDDAISALEA